MNNEEKLELLNQTQKNTLLETLDIQFTHLGDDHLIAKMPVNERVHQPDGILHGGATFALAETVGSVASVVFTKAQNVQVRGIEMSGNHLRSVKSGHVFARASAIHLGRTTQIWEIKVTNDDDELVSLIKLTTLSLPKK